MSGHAGHVRRVELQSPEVPLSDAMWVVVGSLSELRPLVGCGCKAFSSF